MSAFNDDMNNLHQAGWVMMERRMRELKREHAMMKRLLKMVGIRTRQCDVVACWMLQNKIHAKMPKLFKEAK